MEDVLPEGGEVETARFFDISIVVDGQKVQPAAPVDVRVELLGEDLVAAEQTGQLLVEHFADGSREPQDVEAQVEASRRQSAVSFAADSFSIYAIVVVRMERTVLASDGHNYQISVTYGDDAGVPEDAELVVEELLSDDEAAAATFTDYYSRAAASMDAASFAYARIFDISIESAGQKVQPTAPVHVSVELLDAEGSAEDFAVLHFAQDEGQPQQMEARTVDNTVSFDTEGFSAYAIVQGPSEVPLGWQRVSSMDGLRDLADRGLRIGTTGGFFLTGTTAIGTQDKSTTGIVKIKPAQNYPPDEAASYFFEAVEGTTDQFYVYCLGEGGTRRYVRNTGDANLYLVDEADRTAFTVQVDNSGRWRLNNGNRYWNMWNGVNGNHIAAWTTAGDSNNYFYLWDHIETTSDPYGLDGTTYGLMNWDGGLTGRAVMANSSQAGRLDALPLTVMSKASDNGDKLFVPDDADISDWTFRWISEDRYYLTASVAGETRYLSLASGGASLTSEPDASCRLQVIPGTGAHAGEIALKAGGATLTYGGKVETGYGTGGAAGTEWLKLVETSELTTDYFLTYTANKVSVSDESVTNDSRVIVYTRVWDDAAKRYKFYAIDHDGSLVLCQESGDTIQWAGSRLNTMLWNFVEYYHEGTTDPTFYYELYNQYSDHYLAPHASGGQVLSDEPVGINMDGRRTGGAYSQIAGWDDEGYAYAGLKVEGGRVVSCPIQEADDFYFAIVQDIDVDDELHTVKTVDHTQYGITMRIVDFTDRVAMSNHLGSDNNYKNGNTEEGLLSTGLGPDGYPVTKAGNSLATWFAGAQEANHLFVESSYLGTGYFEFDSTQNFAHFDVYQELGTMSGSSGSGTGKFYTHGQFMPFNNIEAGNFVANNRQNLTAATGANLPNSDPRKYERLYAVTGNYNYYNGVELEAAFTQTPNGLDDWGHDIIYEFTGDDDFWLYVDGELIIDLGGIHDALPGSVNYCTGDVSVNGKKTTLRALFEQNYRARNPQASNAEVEAYLNEHFKEGTSIFKDYTTHTMKIYYLECGAGASNLHMRFNLASVKPGTVQLSKALSGVDTTESVLAQFPYQVYYTDAQGTEHLLSNQWPDDPARMVDYALYKGTNTPVAYQKTFDVGGVTYDDVFLLKPGEVAEVSFPEGAASYRIVECGVNTDVYLGVTANGEELAGTAGAGYQANRRDFGVADATTDERAVVNYVNEVNPEALRTLTITKRLYREDGSTEIGHGDDATTFSFRLYLGTEFDEAPVLADLHTYHIKDPDGAYVRWDRDTQAFVSLGKTSYDELTAKQKEQASFVTSMYGSISRIPVGYTVEVRELLAGTAYLVEERDGEIPDGYSRQRYELFEDADDAEPSYVDAKNPAGGTIEANKDPKVVVSNLKGWGLRVNKAWSDASYMTDRDATFFAVFTDDGDGNLTLVEGTVRRLGYRERTLYWYFLPLPVPDVPFMRYEIREVIVEHPDSELDEEGSLVDPGAVTPIDEDGTLAVGGTQKGESTPGTLEYTVHYEKGEVQTDANVRVDEVANERPGIELRKQDWSGNVLAGATFTLEDENGTLIGTFTSDAQGLITLAFLRDGVPYTLTETKAPQGYQGLMTPATITLSNGVVTVEGIEDSFYELEQGPGTTPTLTLKNHPSAFAVVKVDGDSQQGLAGAHFALHRQVTVDGVTSIDLTPLAGCEDLVTDDKGLLPKVNETLPAGTYELREKSAPEGYEQLAEYIRFAISPTGAVSLVSGPETVGLASQTREDGIIASVLTIANYRHRKVSVWKTDLDGTAIATGASFELYRAEDFDDATEAPKAQAAPLVRSTTNAQGLLALGSLAVGEYRLVETEAPEGYSAATSAIRLYVFLDRVEARQGGNTSDVAVKGDPTWVAGQDEATWQVRVWNSSGLELPASGGRGTAAFGGVGVALLGLGVLLMLLRRRGRAA